MKLFIVSCVIVALSALSNAEDHLSWGPTDSTDILMGRTRVHWPNFQQESTHRRIFRFPASSTDDSSMKPISHVSVTFNTIGIRSELINGGLGEQYVELMFESTSRADMDFEVAVFTSQG